MIWTLKTACSGEVGSVTIGSLGVRQKCRISSPRGWSAVRVSGVPHPQVYSDPRKSPIVGLSMIQCLDGTLFSRQDPLHCQNEYFSLPPSTWMASGPTQPPSCNVANLAVVFVFPS